MNADCINEGQVGKFRPMTPTTAMIAMGNNDKTVKVSDPLTRMLVGALGFISSALGLWFANEI